MRHPIDIDDPEWVDKVHATIVPRPVTGERVRAGSSWVSRATARRGMVRWVSKTEVCLAFAENVSDVVIHSLDDFKRLYAEAE